MKYAEFITSLSIPKGRVNNIHLKKSRKKRNVRCFWIFKSAFELSTTLVFSFSEIFKALH